VGANRLTNDALDPSSRMPEFKVCAASVSLVDEGRLAASVETSAADVPPPTRAGTAPAPASEVSQRSLRDLLDHRVGAP
jgi:hypothetical protein